MNTVLFVNATIGFSENLFLVKCCSDNQMEANPSKFQVLIANEKPEKPFSISIKGSQIYGEPFVKLLGVLLDNRLSFNEHVSTICRKAGHQLNHRCPKTY